MESERQAMSKLGIIIGSTRPTRQVDNVVPWVIERAKAHPRFEVEVLDLRDWPLPHFGEHMGTLGDPSDPTYSDPLIKRWNQTLASLDAFVVVTPEYNHSIPGVLKNAIDSAWMSFALRHKPIAAVSYSLSPVGGARAIEHLYAIAIEAEMVPVRNTTVIGGVAEAFGSNGEPTNPMTDSALRVSLDDLAWMSEVLMSGRSDGVLAPGTFRLYGRAPHPTWE
jgi:NAD(P)H-dependent FMN reductase